MSKTKKSWIDDLEPGDIIQGYEPGVTYSFDGINDDGEYMLYGMPYGYSREIIENFFKLIKKKDENKINDNPKLDSSKIGTELGYMTIEQIKYRYNGIIELKLSRKQDIHDMIDRLICEKYPFIVQNYKDTTLEINFNG